jgi:hypothetical protein
MTFPNCAVAHTRPSAPSMQTSVAGSRTGTRTRDRTCGPNPLNRPRVDRTLLPTNQPNGALDGSEVDVQAGWPPPGFCQATKDPGSIATHKAADGHDTASRSNRECSYGAPASTSVGDSQRNPVASRLRASPSPTTRHAPPSAGYGVDGGRVPGVFGGVMDGLDVVAVGVEHERSVVAPRILRPWSRSAVVTASCRDRGCIERIDLVWRLRGKSDMDRRADLVCERDHEVIETLGPECDVGDGLSLVELREPQR